MTLTAMLDLQCMSVLRKRLSIAFLTLSLIFLLTTFQLKNRSWRLFTWCQASSEYVSHSVGFSNGDFTGQSMIWIFLLSKCSSLAVVPWRVSLVSMKKNPGPTAPLSRHPLAQENIGALLDTRNCTCLEISIRLSFGIPPQTRIPASPKCYYSMLFERWLSTGCSL